MRYLLRLEAIGDNLHQWNKAFRCNPFGVAESMNRKGFDVSGEVVKVFKLGRQRAWCARVLGLDPRYRFARQFLKPKKDYSEANSTGSRGIYLTYLLEPGIYDINERVSWKHSCRYFLQVLSAIQVREIGESEVIACLNGILENQS